jgi:steroid delta-isomerase
MLGVISGAPAGALPPGATEQAIRAALTTWMADFNAGRTDRVCTLFAADLRATYRGFPDRGYREICDLLRRSLTDPRSGFSYGLDIQEVLVSGDMAVVRLVWRLTVTPRDGSPPVTSHEPGMDVFNRQADGSWQIIRYLAFEAP